MTEIITTLNSTYEVDWEGLRVRRLRGASAPTAHQAPDGEWQQAAALFVMTVGGGEVLHMVWDLSSSTLSSKITARAAA